MSDFNQIVFEYVHYDGPAAMKIEKRGDGSYIVGRHGYSEKLILTPAELGCLMAAAKAATGK